MRIEIVALALALALAGCSTRTSDITDESPPPREVADDADVGEPVAPEPDIESEPIEKPPKPVIADSSGPLSGKDIKAALVNKTYRYSAGSRSGTVSYFSDGTFTYNEKGKGEGTGIWEASGDKLCEALDPSSFLPKGSRSECHPFVASNGSYVSGPKRLSPT